MTRTPSARTFGRDLDFLRRHVGVVVLADESRRAQIVVVPGWQGRVMTSTADGLDGASFGWVNRPLIASGKLRPHFNVFGGEDRFWLGPESGQFSLFHAPGAPYDLEHWFTPPPLDTEAFRVTSRSSRHVRCRHEFQVLNHAGTRFQLRVNREVRLLDPARLLAGLDVQLPRGVRAVAYESRNTVTNTGMRPWKKATGLPGIWMLGMFNASARATVILPFQPGAESKLGPVVNDTYFGKVPAERLQIVGGRHPLIRPAGTFSPGRGEGGNDGDAANGGVILFRADARLRTKIGLSPRRAKSLLGSYDPTARALTLVNFTRPRGATDYVNSMWEQQKNPYGGDVVNSYNDGPPAPGKKQMGKFFELESSSPALALKPGQRATHVHQTIHVQGDGAELDTMVRAALGVTLQGVESGFKR